MSPPRVPIVSKSFIRCWNDFAFGTLDVAFIACCNASVYPALNRFWTYGMFHISRLVESGVAIAFAKPKAHSWDRHVLGIVPTEISCFNGTLIEAPILAAAQFPYNRSTHFFKCCQIGYGWPQSLVF